VSAVHLSGLPSASADLPTLLASAPTWDDVAWLATQTRLPIWLKGILHPEDARQASRCGAVTGLIVSNHGGRVLDTAVSTAWALPHVVNALAEEAARQPQAVALPVLVDGGIRRGTDVLKALALGARAVLIGRPQVFALASGGALGVAQMLRLLRDEFAAAMALCGCHSVAELHPQLLVR
jgi:4-hydroxymandelate oxidase